MNEQLAILAVFVFFYSVLAGRIERGVLSGPIIFVSAGFLLGPLVLGWFPAEPPDGSLRMLADLTLALFLFTDAANANRRTLEHSIGIPARLLMLGLPLTLLLGLLLALVLFDTLSLPECAILAVMLAATDAALGKAVITHPQVPDRLREALNVESGLNDGFCVPLLLAMIALEFDEEGITGSGYALELLVRELGIGLGVGLVVAIGGAFVIRGATRRGWLNPVWSQVSSMALALSAFALAQSLHGSGYIAAFTGGMVFGFLAKEHTHDLVLAAESTGETLALMSQMQGSAADLLAGASAMTCASICCDAVKASSSVIVYRASSCWSIAGPLCGSCELSYASANFVAGWPTSDESRPTPSSLSRQGSAASSVSVASRPDR